ncbi:MAG: hypothetical protein ACJ76Y_05595 [Thermoanaerobaculia bacterium]
MKRNAKIKSRLTLNRAAWLTGAVLVAVLVLAGAPAAAQIDSGYFPVTGKWTRGAADSVAWVDLATWKLVTRFEEQPSVASTDPQPQPWIPVAGDWDGDGVDTVQMLNVQDWRLIPLEKGPGTDVKDPDPNPWMPVAGDWDGRGVDTVLVFDLRDGSIHRLEEGPVKVDRYIPAANPWRPLAGDWDGKGRDTIATYRDDEKAPDTAGLWIAVAGDWQGRGIDTVALLHGPTGTLVLPEETTATAARPRSRTAARGGAGGPAPFFDKALQLPGGCYQKNTDYTSVVKVFHYGVGGCMVLVIESWYQWTCCPIDINGTTYSCGKALKLKTHSYGYSNC